MSELPIGIVGGGIVGLAIARELVRRHAGLPVVVLEKEDRLAAHQTGHNSGVVHAGIYYKPGSLKAQLCTRGRSLLREFCAENGLPYDQCGKLVVAVDSAELGRLDALQQSATENAVPGLRRIGQSEIPEVEPHATGLAALHSPATGITDYVAIAEAYAAEVEQAGGSILLSAHVSEIRRRRSTIEILASGRRHRFRSLIVCGGLQADRLARMAGAPEEPRIVPFRGEYMVVSKAKQEHVRGMIYPVPDPKYPFLGVHFTRRVAGGLEVGPNAVLALKREGYGRFHFDAADVAETLRWPGFWTLARRNWRTGAKEMIGSLSIAAYMRAASRYVPSIEASDVRRASVGIRAQALDRDGSLVDDFRISDEDGIVSVRNAPSPAATSSLAIAEYVVDQLTLR